MSTNHELIVAPFKIYLAPVGETFPGVAADPAGNWALLGRGGDLAMGEEGLTITHAQTVDLHRTYGATGPRKASRSSEDLTVAFTLLDLTLEGYTQAINAAAPTEVSAGTGAAGYRHVNLHRGVAVGCVAMLIRGKVSGYGDGFNTQYEIPTAAQTGAPAVTYVKNALAGLSMEFMAIEDAAASSPFGRLVMQNAAAL